MDVTFFFSILGFLWVAAITPGPNNTLLTASGANYGFFRTLPLLIGVMLGMQCILLLVALGIGSLILFYPTLHLILKVAGSIYLLWLAWKIATAKYEHHDKSTATLKPISFWQGGILQIINPKAWIMTLGSVASFSLAGTAYVHSIVMISVGIALVNIVAGCIWAVFGSLMGLLLRGRKSWTIFNFCMGAITAACVLLIWR